MVRKSFKEIITHDIKETFLNVSEFADIHNIDGREMPVQIDDNEIIEREKKSSSQ